MRAPRKDSGAASAGSEICNIIPSHSGQGGDSQRDPESRKRHLDTACAGMTARLGVINSLSNSEDKSLPRQTCFFGHTEHEIQILDRHPGGAFAEVVEPGHEQYMAGLVRQHGE